MGMRDRIEAFESKAAQIREEEAQLLRYQEATKAVKKRLEAHKEELVRMGLPEDTPLIKLAEDDGEPEDED